jgi:hypothetical protein
MDYDELIAELIAEGTPPREAARIAAATVRAAQINVEQAKEKQAIQVAASRDLTGVPSADAPLGRPSYLARTDGRLPVQYGDETPHQARERWSAQERMDPNGVYSDGGMSGGGIFGGGPVATESYDPAAYQRAAPVQNMRVQQETLHILSDLRRDMAEERALRQAAEERAAELEGRRTNRFVGGRGQTRQLASKRRKGEE